MCLKYFRATSAGAERKKVMAGAVERKLYIKNKKGADITPGMFGVFYEDINYCCDGGISAQQLENAAFEFVEAFGCKDNYSTKYDGLYGWIAYPTNGDGAVLSIGQDKPVSETAPHYLVFEPKKGQCGFANKAYDGIYLREGMKYHVNAYLKSDNYSGSVRIKVGNQSCVLTEHVTGKWVKYEAVLEASAMERYELFVVELDEDKVSEGSVLCADFFSFAADDAVCGVFRRDITEMLKSMKPGFMRFPGGCIVEGNELSNRYQWKHTVGSREERIRTWNRWAVHGNEEKPFAAGAFSHYNQSYDIGYYEYFLLCEYIGAKPLPVQNVGLACQYQSTQRVSPESEEFKEYVQDVLDLIEFANGSTDTQWGALRAKMGHPDSFNLEMIGIGNEQWENEESEFFRRYSLFEKAVHEKYPEIKLIGSAGPDVKSDYYRKAWDYYRDNKPDNFVYAVDEHYYCPPEWFMENTGFYDSYPRNVKVFAGEYAAHVQKQALDSSKNTLGAALSEAAFLTGVERNADVVVLASYAPLFARLGYTQWTPDMIWFDDATCFPSPSFLVQKMYSGNMGDYVVENRMDGDAFSSDLRRQNIFHTVSYDSSENELIVKLVNPWDFDCVVTVDREGFEPDYSKIHCFIMGEVEKDAYNSLRCHDKVRTYEFNLETTFDGKVPDMGRFSLRARTFSIFRIKCL